jgi:hypothetical protein
MPNPRWPAIAALALACAGTPSPEVGIQAPPAGARYALVEVALAPDAAAGLDPQVTGQLATWVRQSARDWLEQEGRLAPDGDASLLVTIEAARLRSSWVAWLFAWLAPPDSLEAHVIVLRGLDRAASGAVRVESALSGYSWRDPDARLERLARRLGHRIAEGL